MLTIQSELTFLVRFDAKYIKNDQKLLSLCADRFPSLSLPRPWLAESAGALSCQPHVPIPVLHLLHGHSPVFFILLSAGV